MKVSVYQPCEYVDIRTIQLTPEILGHGDQMDTDGKSDVLGAVPNMPFYQAVLTSLLPDPPKELAELLADSNQPSEM